MGQLGQNIKAIREKKQFNRSELAEELGISESALERIENGLDDISINQLNQLASVLGVSPRDFISSYDQNTDNTEVFELKEPETLYKTYSEKDAEIAILRDQVHFLQRLVDKLLDDMSDKNAP